MLTDGLQGTSSLDARLHGLDTTLTTKRIYRIRSLKYEERFYVSSSELVISFLFNQRYQLTANNDGIQQLINVSIDLQFD
jgi:hypothetical protein